MSLNLDTLRADLIAELERVSEKAYRYQLRAASTRGTPVSASYRRMAADMWTDVVQAREASLAGDAYRMAVECDNLRGYNSDD